MLNTEELLELEDSIREELEDHLLEVLAKLNRTEQLEDLLQLLGMEYLLEKDSSYQVYKTGKIVVIGQSDVPAESLLAIAKKLNIDKNRFELYLDYEDAKLSTFKKCSGNHRTV